MSAEIISPTVGRMVWFYPADHDGIGRLKGQPLSGQVAAVHHDRLVNLCVLDAYGNPQARTNVTLVQPGDAKPDGAAHATWMPYQVSAAGIAPAPTAEHELLQGGEGPFAETDGTSASETGLVNTTPDGVNDAPKSNVTTESQL